ncbi:MAG TPA: PASTA domain-containing protein [Mycobacteriales bacterium]|jgi:hypothetical protein|nr:PASTA domain-containing protein [Mycobacteriales bacterium]
MLMTRAGDQTLAARVAAQPGATDDLVLDVVAQVGFALQALHDDGDVHGGVTADLILLHDDGSITLLPSPAESSEAAGDGTPAADLAALGRMSLDLLTPDTAPATRRFVAQLAEPARGESTDAGDVARTALALRAGTLHDRQPPPVTADPAPDPAFDLDRRRVRNRLIAIGAAVVLVGVGLLVVLGRHTGQTVPDVRGDTFPAAAAALHAKGFAATERLVAPRAGQPAGQVVSQSPGAGNRVHAGSTITVVVTR